MAPGDGDPPQAELEWASTCATVRGCPQLPAPVPPSPAAWVLRQAGHASRCGCSRLPSHSRDNHCHTAPQRQHVQTWPGDACQPRPSASQRFHIWKLIALSWGLSFGLARSPPSLPTGICICRSNDCSFTSCSLTKLMSSIEVLLLLTLYLLGRVSLAAPPHPHSESERGKRVCWWEGEQDLRWVVVVMLMPLGALQGL